VDSLNEPNRSNTGKKRGRPKKVKAEQEDSNQLSNGKHLGENNGVITQPSVCSLSGFEHVLDHA
jgi:hypothetical protein